MSDDRWPRLSVDVLLIDSHISRALHASLEPQSGSHETLHFPFGLDALVVDEPEYRECIGGLASGFSNLGSGHLSFRFSVIGYRSDKSLAIKSDSRSPRYNNRMAGGGRSGGSWIDGRGYRTLQCG
jgi:hypothetical protein